MLVLSRLSTSKFLAPGVGELGPLELDPFPTIHMRDIMSHEAHRHPYMEAMGTIYLMKLRYGNLFCSNAGSCWRLVFVYALMPWLQKYRVFDTPGNKKFDEDGNEILTDDDISKEMREVNLAYADAVDVSRSFAVTNPRILANKDKKDTRKLTNKDQTILRLRGEVEGLNQEIADLKAALKEATKLAQS